jgi:hypothetical protein
MGLRHTCIVTTLGEAKCFGINDLGQLGDNTVVGKTTATQVSGLTSGMLSVTCGESHSCGLTTGGGAKWFVLCVLLSVASEALCSEMAIAGAIYGSGSFPEQILEADTSFRGSSGGNHAFRFLALICSVFGIAPPNYSQCSAALP